jgi:hypothetical protein
LSKKNANMLDEDGLSVLMYSTVKKILDHINGYFYKKDEVDDKLKSISPESHNHDSRYYLKQEVDNKLDTKSNTDHNHDERYYTQTDVDNKLGEKASLSHTHTLSELGAAKANHNHDERYYTETEVEELLKTKSNVNHTHTLDELGVAAGDHNHDDRYYTESEIDKKLDSKIDKSLIGEPNGLAELDDNGIILTSQLPSSIDDIIEGYYYEGKFYGGEDHVAEITAIGSKIYVDLNENKAYRWTGSYYQFIGNPIVLGETASNAYRGDRGKIAYDHSQSEHARVDATKVEASETNGNIIIDGVEVPVYKVPEGNNPYGVTKDDIGLSNVQNVSTNDQTPTYEESDELETLTNGETLSTAFGKISKAISEFISHINNKSNPHSVTKAQIGLENVGNYKAVSTVSNQGLTDAEKSNARANIDVYDATLTIQKNGETVQTFSSNQKNNATVNIEVPTDYLSTSGGKLTGDLTVNGNITATGNVTATQVYNAIWNADYAEVFDYVGEAPKIGDIVEISDDRKVCKASMNSSRVVGVCSKTYCILAGGTIEEVESGSKIAVGLVGCLYIRIVGSVFAGDKIICAGDGYGVSDNGANRDYVIAKALETNTDQNEKLVWCLIKSF